MSDDPAEPMLTINEVAQALRVSKTTVFRLVRDGLVPAERIGGSLRVPTSGLDGYVGRLLAGLGTVEIDLPVRRPGTEGAG